MKNSKNNNSKNVVRNNNKSVVRNSVKTLKGFAHTWNQVAKHYQVSKSTSEGRKCLEAFNNLGLHMQSLSALSASDFFTAWWGGLKDEKGNPMMWKAIAYDIAVNGKDYVLYEQVKSDDGTKYKRVSVYTKKSIISQTDKSFDKKVHIAPTEDVVLDGLEQCALSSSWTKKVAKALAKAESLTEGYINMGTAQQPKWTKVQKSADGSWNIAKKTTKKAA